MNRTWRFIPGLLVVIPMLAMMAGFALPIQTSERRSCGHYYTFQEKFKWLPLPRASHCCRSGKLVFDLNSFAMEQELYRHHHQRTANSIAELELEFPTGVKISQSYEFQTDGTNWQVVVPKTERLASNYLLVSSGTIFFNESRIPTTNDVTLKTRWR